MTSSNTIPKKRLRWIPTNLQLAHEYCFFLHDQWVHLLKEYLAENAQVVSITFKDKNEAETFSRTSAQTDSLTALRTLGYHTEAREVVLRTVTVALVGDLTHHIFEALKCLEKRKIVVAINLLRKPLMDSLSYLSWMVADKEDFLDSFGKGTESLSPAVIGPKRREFITKALAATDFAETLDAKYIYETIYSKKAGSLYELFQHAVHLITDFSEIRTGPENFNFIFKNPSDNDTYEGLYNTLPKLFLFLHGIIIEAFHRIHPIDEGAKMATITRSTFAAYLLEGGKSEKFVLNTLSELGDELQCVYCQKPVQISKHNASRILLAESFRCTCCRRVNAFPFSHIF